MRPLPADAATNRRVSLSPFVLTLLVGVFITAAHNLTFWSRLAAVFPDNLRLLASFGLAIFAAQMFLIVLISPRWLLRPVLVVLLILGAVSSFYQDVLGATVDREMIQNAITTTVTESKHLITLPFALHVAIYGLLPSAFVLWVGVRRAPLLQAGLGWAISLVLYAAIFLGTLLSDSKDLMSTGREHQEVIVAIQPFIPARAIYQYSKMMLKKPTVVAEFGRDAKPGPSLSATTKPVLMVIWVGETARAQNWGINGYARDTTPELAKRGVVNFSDVTACGTSTAVSMPCMFSHLGHADYTFDGSLSSENLLDVLAHAGFKVEWWDNNTGDKDIAARQTTRMMKDRTDPVYCGRGECIDGVFLDLIREKAASITENTVLALHMIGSHGPSYFLRYPEDKAVFTPACTTPEVANCSAEELTNAYDNTLRYTDWVLAQSIDVLNAADRVLPMMFFLSDHGESLGENGLYLHGAPWFMAPGEQIKVPMVLWMADRYQTALGLQTDCVGKLAASPLSQDNMFSSILGLADVQTAVRLPALDITAGCRAVGA
jgi:lipid A ethanolaminephosphotransferase